jgi:hypothetical protein
MPAPVSPNTYFHSADPLLTFRQAAMTAGVPYWKIQRAAKTGVLRTYKLLNSRQYVRMSDIARLLTEQHA